MVYSPALQQALRNVSDIATRTPLKRLRWLEAIVGVPVYAKLEFQQQTGSFKFRGALNALRNCPQGGTVIAASAGNHALAIAQAAQLLGVDYRICIPANASRLKREKLVHLGAQLVEKGDSLEEATQYAQQLAEQNRWTFISPFNNSDVIYGAATLFVESLEQAPEIDTVFVPVGGGGLISAALWLNEDLTRKMNIIGVEPADYASVSASLAHGAPIEVLNRPTLADGLAVQLDRHSITFQTLQTADIQILQVSEEQLAAGTVMMLQNESWLVEPSGASTICALIDYAARHKLAGPVLLPLSGGNIQKSTLNKVLLYPFSENRYMHLLGLKGENLGSSPLLKNIGLEEAAVSESTRADVSDVMADLDLLNRNLAERIVRVRRALADYVVYCSNKDLDYPQPLIALSDRILDELEAARVGMMERRHHGARLAFETKALVRGLNFAVSMVEHWLEWRSPTYDQAVVPQFFQLGSQDSPGVNYDRFGNAFVSAIEIQLREVLGITEPDVGCTVASSGMAAYCLIESFLLRFNLTKTSKIAIAPYIYFEAAEQIERLPHLDITRLGSYDAETIAAEVIEGGYDLLFVDPVANIAELRVCDVGHLAALLSVRARKKITLVVDGTMASAQLPQRLFSREMLACPNVEVLYYESCSKYLQLGLEYSLAGVVVCRNSLRAPIERMRRNSGAILYSMEASLFPAYDRNFYLKRLGDISRSAERLAQRFVRDPLVRDMLSVHYPTLETHPDYMAGKSYAHLGGCVCFTFRNNGLNNVDILNAFIQNFLFAAKAKRLPITKGVSFGFITPRISAASAIAETERAFLRLYSGVLTEEEIDALCGAFSGALEGLVAIERAA